MGDRLFFAAGTTKIFGQERYPDHVVVWLLHELVGRFGLKDFGSGGQAGTVTGGV
ncbi:hypothetical protein HMPREF0290_0601 [Corynebacterium efficiens YS-314]|nr:hypothetical protein HMPREF0290_0601 [Corynebacterium efficiens YS-314]